jgi:hypothetical protein
MQYVSGARARRWRAKYVSAVSSSETMYELLALKMNISIRMVYGMSAMAVMSVKAAIESEESVTCDIHQLENKW